MKSSRGREGVEKPRKEGKNGGEKKFGINPKFASCVVVFYGTRHANNFML